MLPDCLEVDDKGPAASAAGHVPVSFTAWTAGVLRIINRGARVAIGEIAAPSSCEGGRNNCGGIAVPMLDDQDLPLAAKRAGKFDAPIERPDVVVVELNRSTRLFFPLLGGGGRHEEPSLQLKFRLRSRLGEELNAAPVIR